MIDIEARRVSMPLHDQVERTYIDELFITVQVFFG